MMKFNEFVADRDRMYSEMAKKKKKSQPVVMPKPVSNTIKIPSDPAKVARGHAAHRGGAGSHDSRPKRQRTRGAADRAAVREHD